MVSNDSSRPRGSQQRGLHTWMVTPTMLRDHHVSRGNVTDICAQLPAN